MYLIYICRSFIYLFTSEVYIYIYIYIYSYVLHIYKYLCISICTSIKLFFVVDDCSYIGTCVYVKNAYILHCVICDM